MFHDDSRNPILWGQEVKDTRL